MSSALPQSYIVLDTETTGIGPQSRMIELAAVKVINGCIVDQRSQFCDPGIRLPQQIISLTGITDEMLRGRITAAQLLPRFLTFADGLPIIGHNIRFDMRILQYEGMLAHMQVPLRYGADTLTMARQRVKGLPSYSLHALVEHFAIPEKPAHRALADVYATQTLYELLAALPPVE